MSERAVIGFPRWTELLTLAGGSWAADYPLANLKTLPLSRVARSADATVASTQLTATLSPARPVRLVGLCRHNLSLAARYRLRLYQDAVLSTVLYDSGWGDVWPRVVWPSSARTRWQSPSCAPPPCGGVCSGVIGRREPNTCVSDSGNACVARTRCRPWTCVWVCHHELSGGRTSCEALAHDGTTSGGHP